MVPDLVMNSGHVPFEVVFAGERMVFSFVRHTKVWS